MLYVKDLGRMASFYERCFGMATVEADTDGFRVLAGADWELALVGVPAAVAATIEVADPPRRRADTPIKLAFAVEGIEELRPVVAALGGRLDPAESAAEFRGHRHVDCLDPEGNVLQLREPITQRV